MNLDWKAIRPLNGSRSEGFEELCAQLARDESPVDAEFVRKGSPDAGVECYCTLADGSEWGWQAKYFHTLGSSQLSQIDESVETALDKHPALARYFICVPLNRQDPRVQGRQYAMDRWNEHEEKWKGWATARGMNVEFVWWGSSEILDELADPRHIGRIHFWFNKRGFDQQWFQDRLKEAIDSAGPRYTPQVHVDLPIAGSLELFGHSDNEADRVKSLARDIRRERLYARTSSEDGEVPGLQCVLDEFLKLWETILSGFAELEFTPDRVGKLEDLANALNSAVCKVDEVRTLLRRSESDSHTSEGGPESAQSQSPLRNLSESIFQLRFTLLGVQSEIDEAHRIANSSLMILKGDAGTGKTHLLCDFASARIERGAPTVLLMGQRFRETTEPWTQVLQQLGLQGMNTEEFVGALEAAAQAANRRAMIIVDALNEGEGRSIWPAHLAAFLVRLKQSSWIATLLAVRSTYEKAVIPEDVRDQAEEIVHRGFINSEYDAVQTFFPHYGIEIPSSPILRPEFSNPLFLKIICEGLRQRGEKRVPRGFHGITMAFDLYLDAVNGRLASELDYNASDKLVRKALNKIAGYFVSEGDRWLLREEAETIVNELLPGRAFSRSLYNALVSEGVLLEDMRWPLSGVSEEVTLTSNQPFTDCILGTLRTAAAALTATVKRLLSWNTDEVTPQTQYSDWAIADEPQEIVSISYERFVDHIIVDQLLRKHLDKDDPASSFGKGGELTFLWKDNNYTNSGLIEAMCVQVPELTGRELAALAPEIRNAPLFVDAFVQSVVWRRLDALTGETRTVFNQMVHDQDVPTSVLDSLLTISTIPGHLFNAEALDRALRGSSMPSRDAWWSIYLHQAYGQRGAVDRLLDWALAQPLSNSDNIEDQVTDLSAITIAWMLTSSNRFLRDRATKALVSLLTNRIESATRLIDRFSDIDDPYVTERIYAVAYGVAMRSHDPAEVGDLASVVYEKVFASGTLPVHILLRDYARGVIERALYLGAKLDLDKRLIHPPYVSIWPVVPSEDTIQTLRQKDHWIFNSVMSGDFGIYIIGTNIGWLSLHLDEDVWRSPEERLQEWFSQLSVCEHSAWEEFRQAEETVKDLEGSRERIIFSIADKSDEELAAAIQENDHELEQARKELESQKSILLSALTTDHHREFEAILEARNDNLQRLAPSFDSSLIHRYVVWRVFDLGWTAERFERFDADVWSSTWSRMGSKPERIGKKYQWIAYHEILACISDHYQYRERYWEGNGNRVYEGAWQESLRDIDPSCTLSSTPGGTLWGGHTPAWWGVSSYPDWKERVSHQDWIACEDDIPEIADELVVTKSDGTRWIDLSGDFSWRQSHPVDVEAAEVDRRDIWLNFTGYFIRAVDADAFMDWAKDIDFWGNWMPDAPNAYSFDMFLGEYGWSPAFRYSDQQFYSYHGGGEWIRPAKGCPADVQPASFEYRVESGGYDCSVTDGYTLQLPRHRFLSSLGLMWSGRSADYLDGEGKLAAFDPTAHEDGPSALLVREDLLRQYLSEESLALCWTVVGEKWVIGPINDFEYRGSLKISGAYRYTDQGPEGFLNFLHDTPSGRINT